MGASPSIISSVYDTPDQDGLLPENSWLKIAISTDTEFTFHKLDIVARLDAGVSILDQEKDIVSVTGFKWDHTSVPTLDDDDTNTHEIYRISTGMKNRMLLFCEQTGRRMVVYIRN